jgi:flagella basal body P-ring formation protein FlgA
MARALALLSGLVAVAATLFAVPVGAEPRLRAEPSASGPNVTLGDLFEDAGAAASAPLARAPAPGQRLTFSAGVLQARANMLGVRWRNLEGARQIVVTGGGPGAVTPAASVRPPRETAGARMLAVLGRDVARGETIDALDVVDLEPGGATPMDAIADPAMLIGKTAKRALRANQPVRPADVMETPAIKRGEAVTLLHETRGLRLSLRGRALADAAVGATVKVVNIQSNRTLEAIAEGPGVARVLADATPMAARAP